VPITAGQDEIRPARRFGGLLRQRNFGLLWTGETISQAGNAMAVVEVPLLAVAVLHASTFAVSALTAAAYVPWLVIGLPAGAWVDRLPPRPLMVICDIVAALLYASLPVAAWAGVLTTGQVLAVALLAGAANVFFATAYQVYLPALVAPGELLEGNAKLQGSMSVATIGGSSAAGLAAKAVGDAAALLFNAGSFLVSATCLLLIRARPAPRAPAKRATTVRAEICEGARFIVRDPLLRPMSIYAAIANLANSGSTALVVVFLIRVAGFGAAAVGLLMAATGVGGIAGAMLARRAAGHSARVVAEHARQRAVRAAHPADRPRPPSRVLRRRLGRARRRGDRRQHHPGQLPPGVLPPAPARPGHRQPALPRLRHHPARRAHRRGTRHRPRRPQRTMGHAQSFRPLRHRPAHPPHPGR